MEIYRKILSGVADSLSVRNPIEIFKSTIDIPADAVIGDTGNLISAATFTINNYKGTTANAWAAIFNGPVKFKGPVSGITTGGGGTYIQGSVIFSGASSVLSEDNNNFFWDDANKRLGLGTNVPTTRFQVNGVSFFNNGYSDTPGVMDLQSNYYGFRTPASGTTALAIDVFDSVSSFIEAMDIDSAGFVTFRYNAIGLYKITAGDSIISSKGIFAGDSIRASKSITAIGKIRAGDSIFSFRSIKAGDSIVSNKTVYGAAGVIGALYGG